MNVVIYINRGDKKEKEMIVLKNLKDVKTVVFKIVGLFPKKKQTKIRSGVQELMMNAVEHGNLGIDWNEKTQLIDSGVYTYQEELNKRLDANEYDDKTVHVHYNETDGRNITLTIRDEGKGFNWQSFVFKNMMDVIDDQNHGRGIIMAKDSFDQLRYNECGNEVTCVVSLV